MNKNWIDFNELRQRLDFREVLNSYNVTLTPKGEEGQFVAPCPLPSHGSGKGNTFSVNLKRGIFQCFGCKASGGVLDFAVLAEGKDKRNGAAVREIAFMLYERFIEGKHAAERKPEPERRQADRSVVVNQPLDFELKTLDAKHPWFAEQKLSSETVAHFGLGYCSRGYLAGRIAIPLIDDASQLLGYAGLALSAEGVRDGNPRYLFPAPREREGVNHVFDAGAFLYGGFRIGRAVKDLIVVRECHSVWRLYQGGFNNVAGLMQDECSKEQAELIALLTNDSTRIWFFTDSSEESRITADSFLPRVSAHRLCRWVQVKREAEITPEHSVLAAMQRR